MLLLSTDDLSIKALREFTEDLVPEFQVEVDKGRLALLSIDPPSWVNLSAHAEWWHLALGGVIAVYVGEITKEMAKSSWKGLSNVADKVPAKLAHLIKAIGKLRNNIPERTAIMASIPDPNQYNGASLLLSSTDSDRLAAELALFVHHLPALNSLIQTHRAADQTAATGYFLTLDENGNLKVSWFDMRSMQPNDAIVLISTAEA